MIHDAENSLHLHRTAQVGRVCGLLFKAVVLLELKRLRQEETRWQLHPAGGVATDLRKDRGLISIKGRNFFSP